MATLHEYVMARMKRGELDLLKDDERDYFKEAVSLGRIKPQQRDIPPVTPTQQFVSPNINYELSMTNRFEPGSAAFNKLRSDIEKSGTHDLYRYTTYIDPDTGKPSKSKFSFDGETRLRVLPKGALTRKSEWSTNVWQQIGHQGLKDMTDGSGRKVADYPYSSSVVLWGGVLQAIPLITKNTNRKELDHLLSGKDPKAFPGLIERAESSAIARLQKGLSPFFAGPGSEKLTPVKAYGMMDAAMLNIGDPKSQSKIKALFRGLGEGATVEFPRMAGEALRFMGAEKLGRIITDWSDRQAATLFGSKPEYEGFARWLYDAGKIVATSAIPGGISATGTRLILGIGIRFKRIKGMEASLRGALKEHRILKKGAAPPASATTALPKDRVARFADIKKAKGGAEGRWGNIKKNARQWKKEKNSLTRIQKAANRAIALEMGSFFMMSAKVSAEDAGWARVVKLEEQGDFEAADALRQQMLWAPWLIGLIEGTGEYFGTKYLAKLFMVSEAEILAKTSNEYMKKVLSKTFKQVGVEMGTEFGQQTGQAAVSKYSGIRPDARIWEEGLSILGPAGLAALMFGGMSGFGNIPRAQAGIKEQQRKLRLEKNKEDNTRIWNSIKEHSERFQAMDDNELKAAVNEMMGGYENSEYYDTLVEYVDEVLADNTPADLRDASIRHLIITHLSLLHSSIYKEITDGATFRERILSEAYVNDQDKMPFENSVFNMGIKEAEIIMANYLGIDIKSDEAVSLIEKDPNYITKQIYEKFKKDYEDEYNEIATGEKLREFAHDKVREEPGAKGETLGISYDHISKQGDQPLEKEIAFQKEVLDKPSVMHAIKGSWNRLTGMDTGDTGNKVWGEGSTRAREYFILHPAKFKAVVNRLVEEGELVFSNRGRLHRAKTDYKKRPEKSMLSKERIRDEKSRAEVANSIRNIKARIAKDLPDFLVDKNGQAAEIHVSSLLYIMERVGFIGGNFNSQHTWLNHMYEYLDEKGTRIIRYDAISAGNLEVIKGIIANEFGLSDVPSAEYFDTTPKDKTKTVKPRSSSKKLNIEAWNTESEEWLIDYSEGADNPEEYSRKARKMIRRIDEQIREGKLGHFFDEKGNFHGDITKDYTSEDIRKLKAAIVNALAQSGTNVKGDAKHTYAWLRHITPTNVKWWDWEGVRKAGIKAAEKKVAKERASKGGAVKQAASGKNIVNETSIGPNVVRNKVISYLLEDNILTAAIIGHLKKPDLTPEARAKLKKSALFNFKESRKKLALAVGYIPALRGVDIQHLDHESLSNDGKTITLRYAKKEAYTATIPIQFKELIQKLHEEYKLSYALLLQTHPDLSMPKKLREYAEAAAYNVDFHKEVNIILEGADIKGPIGDQRYFQLIKELVGDRKIPYKLFVDINETGTQFMEKRIGSQTTPKDYTSYTNELFLKDLIDTLGKAVQDIDNKEATAWFKEWDKAVKNQHKSHQPRHAGARMAYILGMEEADVNDMLGHITPNKAYASGTGGFMQFIREALVGVVESNEIAKENINRTKIYEAAKLLKARHPLVFAMIKEPVLRASKGTPTIPYIKLKVEEILDDKPFSIVILYTANKYVFAVRTESGGFHKIEDDNIYATAIQPESALKIINTIREDASFGNLYYKEDNKYRKMILEKGKDALDALVKDEDVSGPPLSITTTETLAARGRFTSVTFERAKNS
jgi:hypothetical protein